jgi:hypothetical protein
MKFNLFILIFLCLSLQTFAKECIKEIPLRDDVPYAVPRFHELGDVLLFPLSWDLKINRKTNFDQMIISKNGTSLIASYFKDSTKVSLKEWAKNNKKKLKEGGTKVFNMKKKSICIGNNLMKNYTVILEGPNNINDRIEMYKVKINDEWFFINLWAGLNQIKEWDILHEMLIRRNKAVELGIVK